MKNEIRVNLEKSWRRGSGRDTAGIKDLWQEWKGPVRANRGRPVRLTQVVCDTADNRPGRTLCHALLDTLRVGFKS